MENRGILEEIRELLAHGKRSREVIALGYAPGSVYKAQRQVRGKASGTRPVASVHGGPRPPRDAQGDLVPSPTVMARLAEVERTMELCRDRLEDLSRRMGDGDLRGGVSAWTKAVYRVQLTNYRALSRIGRHLAVEMPELPSLEP